MNVHSITQLGSIDSVERIQALNAAVGPGQQVASMVGAAMSTNVADPPGSLTTIIFDKGIYTMSIPSGDSLTQINLHFPTPPSFT
jgi:hypothetical protein